MATRFAARSAGWLLATALAVGATLGTGGCSYDNEEELFVQPSAGCDTNGVTYLATIAPLLSQNCASCHNANRGAAGVVVTDYQSVAALGRSGQLVGVIAHEAGYSPMPLNAPKLSDCDIEKVRAWVRAGMPNN